MTYRVVVLMLLVCVISVCHFWSTLRDPFGESCIASGDTDTSEVSSHWPLYSRRRAEEPGRKLWTHKLPVPVVDGVIKGHRRYCLICLTHRTLLLLNKKVSSPPVFIFYFLTVPTNDLGDSLLDKVRNEGGRFRRPSGPRATVVGQRQR